jgi:hypothetical protein
VDRIRVVSPTGVNFRVNPDTGAFVDGDATTAGLQNDGNLTFAVGDVNSNATPRLVGAAYTNNDTDASTATTNFAIDAATNSLVRQGGANGAAPSPNTGNLFTVGSLGVAVGSANSGFDIQAGTNLGYASFNNNNQTGFYAIDLSTGRATLVGSIGLPPSTTLSGLALVP